MALELDSLANRPLIDDPAARARDQIGGTFLVLSVALACGAVVAARDPYGAFLKHAVWWWVGWALLMLTPALIFTVVPWAMRSVFGRKPRRASEDATTAFYILVGFSVALAAADAAMISLVTNFAWQGAAGMALAYGVAPIAITPAAVVHWKGRRSGILPLVPVALFFNALLVEWAGGFSAALLVR